MEDTEGYIIDTSAWIEFFKGSDEGELVKDFILKLQDSIYECYTPTVVLAEFKKKYVEFGYAKTKFDEDYSRIRYLSNIIPLEENVAVIGGELRAKINVKNISIIDCILLAFARFNNCKVFSKDEHITSQQEGLSINKAGVKNDI